MKYLCILMAVACVCGCSKSKSGSSATAEDTESAGPAIEVTAAEATEIVREGMKAYYEGLSSDDEATRIATYNRFAPRKRDLVRLFGHKMGDKMWSSLEGSIERSRKKTHLIKKQITEGTDPLDVRVYDWRESRTNEYATVVGSIPKGTHLFKAVVANRGMRVWDTCVVVDGRMVFVRNLALRYNHRSATPVTP